ncbi:MAG TPA: UDP-N-acetylmuramate--L-alanine ligase, partial [Rectinemataceae bacterium]|nr:UDP-N-acetylmuramate--L-alanine ligase [Rectinemataceae bacterium]
IYASARETGSRGPDGRALYEALRARRRAAGDRVEHLYFDDPLDAAEPLASLLRPGDLFLTLGAGDNWRLGLALYERLQHAENS